MARKIEWGWSMLCARRVPEAV